MDGFCVRCKLTRGIVNPVQVPNIEESANPLDPNYSKPVARYKGNCPVCNTVIYVVEREAKIIT